ncbi:MAG: PilZ domain-containing protein [Bacillota bacterium]
MYKIGSVVSLSGAFEENIGSGVVLDLNDDFILLKLFDDDRFYIDLPDSSLFIGFELYNKIIVSSCTVLAHDLSQGIMKLKANKTFSMMNRRFSTRFPASIEAVVKPAASVNSYSASVKNVSLKGFMINTVVDLPVNRFVELSLNMNDNPVILRSMVTRKSERKGYYNYGLKVVDTGYNTKTLMNSIIRDLKEKQKKMTEDLLGYL